MIALQSLGTRYLNDNNGNFLSIEDMIASMELSARLVAKHHSLVCATDKLGYQLIKSFRHIYDHIYVTLDDCPDYSSYSWALYKLYAYLLMDKPFFHLDNDVFLYNGLPHRLVNHDYFFQNREWFYWSHFFYQDAIKEYSPIIAEGSLLPNQEMAVNCGIAGFNKLHFLNDYYQQAVNLCQRFMQHRFSDDLQKHHLCVLFEQAFIVPFIQDSSIGYFINDDATLIDYPFTHLIAGSKRNKAVMTSVEQQLRFLQIAS